MPSISIIMPVYKTGKYLAQAVQSVLAQTYADWELILIDDGSPDDSGTLCDTLALRDVRIRVLHTQNRGQGAARNTGLDSAAGVYVVFADSDDVLLPQMLAVLVQKMQGGKDFVRCRFARFYQDDVSQRIEEKEPAADMKDAAMVRAEMLLPMLGASSTEKALCGTACTTLYKLSVIRRFHLHFSAAQQVQSEDLLFNLAYFSCAQSGSSVAEVLYLYRMHEASFSHAVTPETMVRLLRLDTMLAQAVQEQCAAENIQQRLDARLLDGVSVCAKNAALLPKPAAKAQLQLIAVHPRIRGALCGKAGHSGSFLLRLFCFLLRNRLLGVFRLLAGLYGRMQK